MRQSFSDHLILLTETCNTGAEQGFGYLHAKLYYEACYQ